MTLVGRREKRQTESIAGNVLSVTDPQLRTTTFDFSDAYGYADSNALGNETPLPSELPSTVHTYALLTKMTNAMPQSSYTQFDYYLGKPVNNEDANGVVSKVLYNDALDRPSGVDVGIFAGSQLQRHTTFVYSDSAHMVTTQSDQATLNDGVLTRTGVYDGLGRTTETRTAAPEGTIYSKQEFDAMGRVKRTYNPYRTISELTYGYTETSYDALGRIKTVTTPDNALVSTVYSANTTTVTDQATNQRRSITDGLGRLSRVDEATSTGIGTVTAPNQPTSRGFQLPINIMVTDYTGEAARILIDKTGLPKFTN